MIHTLIALACALFLATPSDEIPTEQGATLRVYQVEQAPDRIPAIAPDQTPNADLLIARLDVAADGFGDVEPPFVSHLTGELIVQTPGQHTFRLTSDDGSRLTLNNRLLIDHDGRHGATALHSAPVHLDAGAHPFRIEHFDAGGDRLLRLEWMTPGSDRFASIPAEHLRTPQDITRVTSPGVKRVEDGRRPGDGAPVAGVHPAWTRSNLRPPGFDPKVGAMTFLPDGRLVVGLFDPLQRDDIALPDIESKEPDALYALDNLDADDPADITVTRIAGDLYEPTGLCVVDGVLYVAHRKAVTRLLDEDGDGFFETHQTVGEGWEGWNYHQFAFGLVHIDGRLYTALSTAMAPPGWEGMQHNAGPNGPMRGGIVEIDIATGHTRLIAGGTRTPNGLGLTADGALIYLDNQGTWMSANQLAEIIPGRFYGHYNWTNLVPKLADRFPDGGHPSVYADRPRTPAAVLMPQNEVNNSPTQPLVIPSGPYAGQLLVGELTAGGIRRVALERVNGHLQGALFRFTQGLESGVNRMAWGPDGALYVGGIGAGGNWNWRGTQHGLQRLTPNGTTVFEMHRVEATPTGFRIVFTQPVDPDWLADPANYLVNSWTYTHTADYGGPKADQRPHAVTRVTPAEDARSVTIELDAMQAGRCYHIRTDPTSNAGESIWSTEAWYTLNAVPRTHPPEEGRLRHYRFTPDTLGVGAPPPATAVQLTGRHTAPAMRRDGQRFPPPSLVQDDLINAPDHLTVGAGSGDLVSTTEFGDARIHIEWLSPPGGIGQLAGNSGIYLQDRYEIQILGTPKSDAPLRTDDAGAIYGVKAPDVNASAGPGEWQAFDIWFRAPRFHGERKLEDARITVYWNGQLVHRDVVLREPTGSRRANGEGLTHTTRIQTGPLRLQDHASAAEGPVRFRNVWMSTLNEIHYAPRHDWITLFENPDAWSVRGGNATFEVIGTELVGTTVPNTGNTFFTSNRQYTDFELIYEARTDPRLNSGVQIRSSVIGGFENRTGGLRGPQIEIDPSPRAFSAGIYDEQRRGWLHPLHTAPYARRAFRPGEWNEFRVVATGPVVRTWINGVPAAEIFDAADQRGHIGFQVHDVGDLAEPLQVRFRNARVRELFPR